jgi:hypothetical protein
MDLTVGRPQENPGIVVYYVGRCDGLCRLGNRSFKAEATTLTDVRVPPQDFVPALPRTPMAVELVGNVFSLRNGDLLRTVYPELKTRYRISTKRVVAGVATSALKDLFPTYATIYLLPYSQCGPLRAVCHECPFRIAAGGAGHPWGRGRRRCGCHPRCGTAPTFRTIFPTSEYLPCD